MTTTLSPANIRKKRQAKSRVPNFVPGIRKHVNCPEGDPHAAKPERPFSGGRHFEDATAEIDT